MKWEWKRRREQRRDMVDNPSGLGDIRWTICKQGCMVSLENKVIFIVWASLNGCLHLLRVNVMFISDSIAFLFWVKSQKHMLLNNAGCARLAGILHRKPKFDCEIILPLSFKNLFSHSRGKPKLKWANVWYLSTQLCLPPSRTLSHFLSLSSFWRDWTANGCGCLPLITHFYWAISRLPAGCCLKRVREGLGKINAIFLSKCPLTPPREPTPWGRNVAAVGKKFSSVFIVWRGMNTLVNTLVNTCKYMCICVHSFIIINMYFYVPIPYSRLQSLFVSLVPSPF